MTPRCSLLLIFALLLPRAARPAELATVVARQGTRTVELPAEIAPYLAVALHARVNGYVERVLVDRGSRVRQGELLVELSAPEMLAQMAEAQSKIQAAQAEQVQAEAQLAATENTSQRLTEAARTPGAVAGNDLVLAQKQVDAARALVDARSKGVAAARAALQTLRTMTEYLRITAPFDGVVTERMVHPGALVGPTAADPALLEIQQVSRLRVVVPLPEEDVGGIPLGARVEFTVPTYPHRIFTARVARPAHALDRNTRTMAVEMDAANQDGALAPGMFPAVRWPVRSSVSALFVPKTSVVTTNERTFAIRDRGGRAEWVDVKKGAAEGDLIEVTGNLKPGDRVVARATDEIRDGSAIEPAARGTR